MNFDFRPIKEKYPKAWYEFQGWAHSNFYSYSSIRGFEIHSDGSISNMGLGSSRVFNPLSLDFFFDEQGIFGNVEYAHESHWIFHCRAKGTIDFTSAGYAENNDSLYPHRAEAITALWLKEFEILEARLV